MNLLAFLYPITDDVNRNYRDYSSAILIQSIFKKYVNKKNYLKKIHSLRKIQLWWKKLSQKKHVKNTDSVIKIYCRKKKKKNYRKKVG